MADSPDNSQDPLDTSLDDSPDDVIEQRLAAIVESSDDAIISKDLNGVITSWNRGAQRIFGYDAKEMIGQSIRVIIPVDRNPEEDHVLDRIRKGERIEHYETLRRRKDGTLIPMSLTVSPVRNRAGRIVGASKIARDITDSKRAEEIAERTRRQALFLAQVSTTLTQSRDLERTMEALVSLAVPHIADLCVIDLVKDDREIVTVAMAHVDPARLQSARFLREQHEDPNAPYSSPYVIRTGVPALIPGIAEGMRDESVQSIPERIEIMHALGLVSYICVPMIAHSHTFGSMTLGTESGRHYSETDLRLAEDVAARAALIIEAAHSYEQLDLANRLKDEFLATLSHELRTPLNAVLGYARMLRAGTLSSDGVPRALDVMERNATALTQIVEDVLDVSRIVSGKVRLQIQPVDLRKVLRDGCETIAPAAEAKGVLVEALIDPTLEPIAGDPDRLGQVLWNLLSNAVKFTPRDGRVRISLLPVEAHVELVVSDTGIGVPADFLPHIFERFRQAEGGTTRRHSGLGIGLAIARHIVEMHGGTIQASSEGEGKGSTFRIRLPSMIVHRDKHPEQQHVHARAHQSPRGELPSLTGIHVLVVDDNRDARTLLKEILAAAGARVTLATSGAAAIEAIKRTKPDVLIADLGMPDMDGFDLIRHVREMADPVLRRIPAAALTAYARSEDRTKALRSGFELHLAKPIDPGELVTAVAALSHRRRSDSDPR